MNKHSKYRKLLDDVDLFYASETTRLALASELEKVPINLGQMTGFNKEQAGKTIIAENNTETNGLQLPYEVGWQNTKTI